jgi:hypothetical protein
MGILSPEGMFTRTGKAGRPGLEGLRGKVLASLRADAHGEPCLELGENLFLTAGDVENLLKVKAAFELALLSLLRHAGLKTGDLHTLYLAGALGKHAPLDSLTRLGFLPPGLEEKTVAIGNSALAGMSLLLQDLTASSRHGTNASLSTESASSPQTCLDQALRNVQTLDLTGYPLFYQRYIEHMTFHPVQEPA